MFKQIIGQSKKDIMVFTVAGIAGEGINLGVGEKKKLIEAWVLAGKPLGIKIIAQIGGIPEPDIIHLVKANNNLYSLFRISTISNKQHNVTYCKAIEEAFAVHIVKSSILIFLILNPKSKYLPNREP